MNSSGDRAVARVIEAMYQRIGDELTIDDMARTAMYSKFHFSRMFRQVTGVSPGRFLSAVRFQEAKWLLGATSLSVAEISNRVGYSSLGTFSTRFKSSVGVTPTEYRSGGFSWCPAEPLGGDPAARLLGQVCEAMVGRCGSTFLGLFPDPVPHRAPARWVVLPRPGPFVFEDVPTGSWYLLAHAAVDGDGDRDSIGSVGRLGPITIRPGAVLDAVDLTLEPMRTVDLPVLRAPFVARPPELRLRTAR